MGYNLVEHDWIPVRRLRGAVEWIAPWRLTESYPDSPIVALAPPRADFAGALTEFLIGLVQTALSPASERDWRAYWYDPPTPDALLETMAPRAYAFDLDGEGPRFLQDLEELEVQPLSIGQLLIDAPGARTLRNNADLFVKRGGVDALCRPCAAVALFTLQAYAPSGGAGHRVSIRGGGPMTTLVVADDPVHGQPTLWSQIWANVLPASHRVLEPAVRAPAGDEATFPWLAPTRTSERDGGRATYIQEMQPLHMYWGMPRRIRLDFSPPDGACCDLCGEADKTLVRTYRTRPHGMNYEGLWSHPLTPSVARKDQTSLPIHPKPGGVTYRYWLGLTASRGDIEGRVPAPVVAHFREERQRRLGDCRARLVAFGYDMDNMKARAWVESEMPLEPLPDDRNRADRMIGRTRGLIAAAGYAAATLTQAIKAALFDKPGDARGNFGSVGERFWRETEDAFFDTLRRLRTAIETQGPDDPDSDVPVRQDWRRVIERTSLAIFDDLVDTVDLADGDFRRVVAARQRIVRALRWGRKFHDLLGLERPVARSPAPSGEPREAAP